MITMNVKLSKIVSRARRMKRIKDGLVLCDNCDTPASLKYSLALSWTACGGCATGESQEIDPKDFIAVG